MKERTELQKERTPHATDGELVAILDRERVDPGLRAHVASCAECTQRLAAYEGKSAELERAFAATPVPPVARRRLAPRRLRRRTSRWATLVAASLLLTVASAAIAALVREWRSDAAARREANAPASVAAAPARAATPLGTIVSFAVAAAELEVRVDAEQVAGELQLLPTDSALASARILGGDQEALVVLPGSVRFGNDAASRASYRVTVPRNVERVTLYVGARRQVIERSALPSTLSLARR